MATKSNEARPADSLSAAVLKKDERARDGAKAMAEYLANGRMVRERMARLRVLRLAKEAEQQHNLAANPAPKKVAAKNK